MLAVEKELHRIVEKFDGLGEASLCGAEWRLQVEEDGLVAQGILGVPAAGLPPGIGHIEASLGSEEVALHAEGVPKRGPGEAAELVDPVLLEEVAIRNPVRYMNGQIGEVDGVGWLLGCGLAPAGQQLAETPACEAPVGMNAGEAFLHVKCEEIVQEARRLGSGPGEGSVDEPEDRRKAVRLVKLEQPASYLPASGADGEQVEELFVLLRRPVGGEQILQGSGIEMLVLHSILLERASLTKAENSAIRG